MMVTYYQGYTLLEVLIALVVVTLSVAATVTVLQQSIYQQTILTEKHEALWVAEEVFNRYQLALLASEKGELSLFNKRWLWSLSVDPNHKITVNVKQHDNLLASLKTQGEMKLS